MRLFAPRLVRDCNASLENVVNHGASAADRAKKTKNMHKYNVISGLVSASRAEGTGLSDFSLGSQASALIIAGSGTTAVTLTYAIWAILLNPTVRRKLEEEVATLANDYNDIVLEKLPYLNAVVTETLRLYGSAPGALPRTTPSKGLQIGNFFIPPGVTCTTQSYTMHRDPIIFADPET